MIEKHADAAKELAIMAPTPSVSAYTITKKVPIPAKAGLIAPLDITIPCGPVIIRPKLETYQSIAQSVTEGTFLTCFTDAYQHLQELNVPTSVPIDFHLTNAIEVTEATTICKAGEVLSEAHADLLNLLSRSPFFDETAVLGSNEQVGSHATGEWKSTTQAVDADVPMHPSAGATPRSSNEPSIAERQRAVTAELENAELARAILVAEIDAITQRKRLVEAELEAATVAAAKIQRERVAFTQLREREGTERYGNSKVKMNVTNEEFFGVW